MRKYHFYLIKEDGHIELPMVNHEAENDRDALGKAKQLARIMQRRMADVAQITDLA